MNPRLATIAGHFGWDLPSASALTFIDADLGLDPRRAPGNLPGPTLKPPPAPSSRYEVLERLGAGGMGEVWRVHDRRLERFLAMKVLRRELLDDTRLVGRFVEEALATASLEHPGIVPVHDYGQLDDGRLFFTMKEVKGRSLGEVVREVHRPGGSAGSFTLRRLIDVFWRVCEAVACAHAHGVIHRDLKPSNVMIGEYGEVLVVDWGLARRFSGPAPRLSAPRPTHAGATTPAVARLATPRPSNLPITLPEHRTPIEPRAASTVSGARSGVSIGARPGPPSAPTRPALAATVSASALAGTPAYMAPEQALGRGARLGPATDIYALGATLYEILSGRAPYSGQNPGEVLEQVRRGPPASPRADLPLPPELVSLCERAMARDPAERFPDAQALAAEVQAWLEGARRREQAERVVALADAQVPVVERLRSEAAALREAAARALEGVKPWEPVAHKAQAWAQEAQASRLLEEAARREVEGVQLLHAALVQMPGLEAAEERLADHYLARHREAEAARDPLGAARYEVLLRGHDRGRHAAYLAGEGALTLLSTPAGARVQAQRYVERGRRLVLEAAVDLGQTPLIEVPLARGSYLLTLSAPGHAAVRYPVAIGRLEHWDGVPPGASGPAPVVLPREDELDTGDCYVPAGWFVAGGDPEAPFSLPRQRVWVEPFVIRRHPVTMAEYLHFLNALVDAGDEAAALRHAPRERPGSAGGVGTLVPVRDAQGHFRLGGPDADGDAWLPDWPVMMIDWFGAQAYAAWSAASGGRSWRLARELEWEKAARGVDGRLHPWGDPLDPTFACVRDSHAGRAVPATIDSFPLDEGPYGARGMAGNVRTWCQDVWRPAGPIEADLSEGATDVLRALRGGSWGQEARRARSATRAGDRPNMRLNSIGVRLVRGL